MARLTIEALLQEAAGTHLRASRLLKPGLFAGWRERQFVKAIDRFMRTLHALRTSEAARAAPEQEERLRELIDGIVDDVERFLAAHGAGTRDRLERNQHLASRIYDLRRAFEAVVRGTTPNPRMTDLRREEQLRNANLPKR